jgi:hypothetical protein
MTFPTLAPAGPIPDAECIVSAENHWIAFEPYRTLADMIDLGIYNEINPEIRQFPFHRQKEEGERQVRLARFSRPISSGDALSAILRRGCRPVTLQEFMALGALHPQLQVRQLIVGLGSACIAGVPKAACLSDGNCQRKLEAIPYDTLWPLEKIGSLLQNVNYAVKSEHLLRLLESIKELDVTLPKTFS